MTAWRNRPDGDLNMASWVGRSAPLKTKWLLTGLLILVVVGYGVSYQYAFDRAENRYRKIITQYYRDYLNRDPVEADLQRWVIYAFDGMGLERIEQDGFVKMKKSGEN